jgi:hypothetical protein
MDPLALRVAARFANTPAVTDGDYEKYVERKRKKKQEPLSREKYEAKIRGILDTGAKLERQHKMFEDIQKFLKENPDQVEEALDRAKAVVR